MGESLAVMVKDFELKENTNIFEAVKRKTSSEEFIEEMEDVNFN